MRSDADPPSDSRPGPLGRVFDSLVNRDQWASTPTMAAQGMFAAIVFAVVAIASGSWLVLIPAAAFFVFSAWSGVRGVRAGLSSTAIRPLSKDSDLREIVVAYAPVTCAVAIIGGLTASIGLAASGRLWGLGFLVFVALAAWIAIRVLVRS